MEPHIGDKRKKLVAVTAHCLLNQNTVVKPLASHEGAVKDLVKALVDLGYGIIQLPCPEALYLGLKRWWMSREQYDSRSYRSFAGKILEPYVALLEELVKDGCRYILLGVRGSPSCATQSTTSNPFWQGEPRVDKYPESTKVERPGVFMEVLLELIGKAGLPGPELVLDVDHEEVAESGLPAEIAEKLLEVSQRLARRLGEEC
ncbi:MAG: CD3072 family TudS-related putative desulfidase [Desulfurococcaceae archaeon]